MTQKIKIESIDAVIFDMDGVITETSAAWKQLFDEYLRDKEGDFRPFEIDPDYYTYIDGKTCYDGIESFLRSRNISIPYGHPGDSPEQETICGLASRKNGYFLKQLKEERVEPSSSIELVRKLKQGEVCTAVVSESQNCRAVLEAAGVKELFDGIVDGTDAAELGLKNKQSMFTEVARRLGVRPERSAVIEHSPVGVEAGKRADFDLVIGVDRAGQGEKLRDHGAHLVVKDLSEIEISRKKKLVSALEDMKAIFRHLRQGIPAVFLDYDGTLTPIVDSPEKAIMSEEVREALEMISKHWRVTVISERDLNDVKKMVRIKNICYAGSHGFDIECPKRRHDQSRIEPFLPELDRAERELRKVMSGIPGVLIERKRFSIAVHYRREADILNVKKRVDQVGAQCHKLRVSGGKKVFEMKPDLKWDKGKALLTLMEKLYVDSSKVVPIYIGDELTDEDAFRAVKGRGIAIRVGMEDEETEASYFLKDPSEVEEFLRALVDLAKRETSRGSWIINYEGFHPEEEKLRETLCTLGNGYFATRGASPESKADEVHYPGTYAAGCYNKLKSTIKEQTIENESMVNVPNWLPLTFRVDGGEWFDAERFELQEYNQELDMSRGTLTRSIRFVDQKGRITILSERRFVHMANPHLAGLETTLVAENWSGKVEFRAALDGRVTNSGIARYQQLNNNHLTPLKSRKVDDETISLQVETNQSHIAIAEAARVRVFRNGTPESIEREVTTEPGYIAQNFSVHVENKKPVTIEKIVSLFTSRDRAISESLLAAEKDVKNAQDFSSLLERHVLAWDHLWKRCQIDIKNNRRTTQILRLHIFHLLQTVSIHSIDLDVGVPPRGLHGEAYRGLIMWDELFIFSFINLRIPDITRALLMYRYRRLPEARRAAREKGYEGAMFPWQSGSEGGEESQTIHLNPLSGEWIPDNSSLQRHINIAIVYNIWQYYQVTGDLHFLSFYGAEMLIEIARFWASIAQYNRSMGRYEIRGVIGPDEFHEAYPDAEKPGIDNNTYTNVMAVWTLRRAIETLELIPPGRKESLSEDLNLKREELNRWDDISRRMRIPFHGDGIISQFEHYDSLKEFDWEAYGKKYGNIHRLDRILKAEGDTPNRYKVSKQADVLMLFYLLSEKELGELFNRLGYRFDRKTVRKNIDYYLKRSSNGSTLSRVVHSWVLAKYRKEQSWLLFKEALESDISDIQGGTTSEGVHLGAMAGTVDLIQRGYAGIETRGDMLRLDPCLPKELKTLDFNIRYRHHQLMVHIEKDGVSISASQSNAAPISVASGSTVFDLGPGESRYFSRALDYR